MSRTEQLHKFYLIKQQLNKIENKEAIARRNDSINKHNYISSKLMKYQIFENRVFSSSKWMKKANDKFGRLHKDENPYYIIPSVILEYNQYYFELLKLTSLINFVFADNISIKTCETNLRFLQQNFGLNFHFSLMVRGKESHVATRDYFDYVSKRKVQYDEKKIEIESKMIKEEVLKIINIPKPKFDMNMVRKVNFNYLIKYRDLGKSPLIKKRISL